MIIAEYIALIFSALFTGVAAYISLVEHPARMALPPEFALREWKPAYHKGLQIQVAFIAIGTLAGALIGAQNHDLKWLVGGMFLFTNLLYTLGVLMKVNTALEATTPEAADGDTMALLAKWGTLHNVRTALGAASVLGYLWAMI